MNFITLSRTQIVSLTVQMIPCPLLTYVLSQVEIRLELFGGFVLVIAVKRELSKLVSFDLVCSQSVSLLSLLRSYYVNDSC